MKRRILWTSKAKFPHYDEVIKVNYDLFDHTYDGTIGETYYSTRRTGGNTNAIYGLAKSLSVMPGDTINMEVFAKYLDPNSGNWTPALTAFMTAVSGGTAPSGTVVDGGSPGSLDSGSFPFAGFFDHSSEDNTAPKAYLNFIVFDRNFDPIIAESGYSRITTASRETGSNVAHDRLQRSELIIKEPGYVYIYLSNENETPVEVYFDDFTVEHIKSPVVQMDDYYPFGLTFNSYQRENSVEQNYKFNGKEEQDELGLIVLDFGWRTYDPIIARWNAIDGMAEKYISFSPYHFAGNNPIRNYDVDGNEFTDAAWVWVNRLIAEINSRQANNNEKIAEKREALAAGGLSEKQANRLNRQIGRLESNNQALETVRGETATLAASDQVYDVVSNDALSDAQTTRAGAGFNFSNGNFEISMPRSSGVGLFAHELKHAHQFETGAYSVGPRIRSDQTYPNFLYDKHDEIEAYNRGALFGQHNYNNINSLPSDYQNVATGPVDATTHPNIALF